MPTKKEPCFFSKSFALIYIFKGHHFHCHMIKSITSLGSHITRQLPDKKVLQFTGFYLNARKTFAVFVSSILKMQQLPKAFEGKAH